MTKPLFGLSLGLGLAAMLAATQIANAQARQNCAARSIVIERLASKFGETRKSVGLGANNGIVEMHASESTGTWSITVTHPNGMTCLVAAGNSFETLNEELPETVGKPT